MKRLNGEPWTPWTSHSVPVPGRHPVDPSLPEFGFSPHGPRYLSRGFACDRCSEPIHEKPGERMHFRMRPDETVSGYAETWCIDCADAHNLPWQGPMVPATLRNRVTGGDGKADPIWDTKFQMKFARNKGKGTEPLLLPLGTVPPSERLATLDYLIATQCCAYHAEGGDEAEHRGKVNDLATDYDTFKTNAIESSRLDAEYYDPLVAEIAESHLNTTPYAVYLQDIQMPGPDGTVHHVPLYGDAVYIANVSRRIAWEKWLDACGPRSRAYFVALRDGTLGIQAGTKERDQELVTEFKRAMKYRWLDSHGSLPTAEEATAAQQRIAGARVLDFIEPDEHARASKAYALYEDADPGRDEFHADPDPKPLREDYAFGPCSVECDLTGHNACTTDGWDLYNLDLAVWTAVEFAAGRIGYAGPSGAMSLDEKSRHNPFVRDEELDDLFE